MANGSCRIKTITLEDPGSSPAYDAYAKKLINRRLVVPIKAVSESVDVAREAGTKVTKKATDLFDNSFADNLDKTGFLKELWDGNVP